MKDYELEFKRLEEKYKCKDCGFYNGDYDCGGDFFLDEIFS